MVTVLADGLVQGVGGGPQAGRDGAGHVGEEAEEFAVAPLGGLFAGFPGGDVAVEVTGEVAGFTFVEVVEGVHDPSVAAPSHSALSLPAAVVAACRDLWLGFPAAHRELLGALLVVGCLFFLTLGAVLR